MELHNLKPAKVSLITKEKFFETLLITMSNSPFLPNYLWDYINLVWDALSLKKSEGMCYTNFVYISFLHKSDETKKVFDLLNMKKKQELYIYEIYNYWLNFFYSNNKACPSKYIFGKIDY